MAPQSTLLTHLDYTAWASARILETASTLTPEQLTHDFKTSDKSIIGTLAHAYAADRIWLHRVHGTAPAKFIDPDVDCRIDTLQAEWPALLARWKHFLATTDPATHVSYFDMKGNPYTTPLWQIVLHLVNHGTHHRGQVSGMLRSLGHVPPPLDLIAYYRIHRQTE